MYPRTAFIQDGLFTWNSRLLLPQKYKKIITRYVLVRSHTLDYYTRYHKQAAIK